MTVESPRAADHLDGAPRGFLYRRLGTAVVFLLLIVGLGTVSFHYLGDGRWSLGECFYMTVITLSTVGFEETLPGMNEVAGARAFTVALIVMGSGTLLYFASSLTAFIVEGDLMGALKRKRMHKRIEKLDDHVVVCGVGGTGIHIVREMVETETPFVAIDLDADRVARLRDEHPDADIMYVIGDATDDKTLADAGIERASGVIAALRDDKDNVFVTITARALSNKARIIAKAVEASSVAKLTRAGADAVVSPNKIGGMRMVSEMLRPRAVQFLDLMLRDKSQSLRIEEVPIPTDSPMIGAQLRDTAIRQRTKALVVALREADGSFVFNPPADTEIHVGATLIVLTDVGDFKKLRAGIADGSIGRRA